MSSGQPAAPGGIDFYDDPGAPRANSLVPSVNVVVINDAGEIPMIRRADGASGGWVGWHLEQVAADSVRPLMTSRTTDHHPPDPQRYGRAAVKSQRRRG